MKTLLQQLNPTAYERSSNRFEEKKLERAFNEVTKEFNSKLKKQLLNEDSKKFKNCCLIAFQYDYWAVQKGDDSKYTSFVKRSGLEDYKVIAIRGCKANPSARLEVDLSDSLQPFLAVVYKDTHFIFF